MAEYADLVRLGRRRRPAARSPQIAKRDRRRSTTRSSAQTTAGDTPERPARPPRPAARQALRARPGLGRADRHRPARVNVVVRRRGHARTHVVDGTTATWAGARRRAWAPGGRLGALLDVAKPGGTIDQLPDRLDAVAGSLDHDRQRRLRRDLPETAPLFNAARPAASAPHSVAVAVLDRSRGTGGPGANDIALAVAALRDGAAVDGPTARSSPASAPTSARPRARPPTPQALTDAVEDRRQSVAGVSIDEEMTNMVRFQRAYQASARAMSTMDEMLDVLINRTGRVGL